MVKRIANRSAATGRSTAGLGTVPAEAESEGTEAKERAPKPDGQAPESCGVGPVAGAGGTGNVSPFPVAGGRANLRSEGGTSAFGKRSASRTSTARLLCPLAAASSSSWFRNGG